MTARARAGAFVLLLWVAAALPAAGGQAARYGTWDKFFYKVQAPVKAAAPGSEVTLLVYHSYPEPLHDVRAVARGAGLTVMRQPAPQKDLPPTEIVSLPISVMRTEAARGETVTLQVEFQAAELPGSKAVDVTVPLTAKAEQELYEQMSVPVGAMEVRVGGLGNWSYVVYLALSLALLGWVLWRRRRLART